MRMEHQEFFLPLDGLRVHAKLDKPEGEALPLLILVHGLTADMEEDQIRGLAEAVSEAGFAVLRVELYGHGQSDGEFRHHTVAKWTSQLCDVIDYASSLPWVKNLYLAGHSQGGMTALLAGAIKRHKLASLLLLSPAIPIWDGSRKGKLLTFSFDPENVPDTFIMTRQNRLFDGTYLSIAALLPVEESIAVFSKPVLIVHGSVDEAVPVSWAHWLGERYSEATVEIVPDAPHCFEGHLQEYFDKVCSFLAGRAGL